MSITKRRIDLDELCDGEQFGITGEAYEECGAVAGIDDGDHQPDGNRQTDIHTIAIGVTDEAGVVHKTLMTWQQARDFASGINLIVDIAEFG